MKTSNLKLLALICTIAFGLNACKQESTSTNTTTTASEVASETAKTPDIISTETPAASEVDTNITASSETIASQENASVTPPQSISSKQYQWQLVYSGAEKNKRKMLPMYLDMKSIQKDPGSNRYLYKILIPLLTEQQQYEQFQSIIMTRGVDCDKQKFVIVEPAKYNTALDGTGQMGEDVGAGAEAHPHRVRKKAINNEEFKQNILKYVCGQGHEAKAG
jgi:hypothetical protein